MNLDVEGLLRQRVEQSRDAIDSLLAGEHLEVAALIAGAMIRALREGGRVIFFGNGGSATEAQHLSAELMGRFYLDRPALPSVSLSDNTAAMTAISNDYAYEQTFARQILGLGRPGDVAVGLSTSGNSLNVVRALEAAKGAGLTTIAFTGQRGGSCADVAEHCFRAPSNDTPRVQEMHLLIGHTVCEIVEAALFGS